MVKSSGLHFISVGLVDNLLEYLKFNDEDVRLAAARSFSSEFCLFVVGY